jgi:hypothetical protein
VQVDVETTFVSVCIQLLVGFIPRRVGDMLVPRRAMVTSAFRVRFRFVASAPSTARESTFSIQLRVFHLIPTNQHACAKAGPLHADPAAALDGCAVSFFLSILCVSFVGLDVGLFLHLLSAPGTIFTRVYVLTTIHSSIPIFFLVNSSLLLSN